MNEDNVKNELIDRLLESENLPDEDLTIDKIVYRAHDFTKKGSKTSFLIERHPGLFGKMSGGKGIGLPAFWEEKTRYTYDLDQEKWEGEVLSSELQYDSYLMAMEEVDSLEEGGFFPRKIDDKEELEAVIIEAQQVIRNYYIEMGSIFDVPDKKLAKIIDELTSEMRVQIEKRYQI